MGMYNGVPRYVRRLLNFVMNKNLYHEIVKLLKWIYNSFIEYFFCFVRYNSLTQVFNLVIINELSAYVEFNCLL
jgi:hypothetical protein